MEIRIGVAGESERCEAVLLDSDSQFLFEFAYQSILRPFTRIELATGKFPQTGHRPAGRSLREQYQCVRVHEGTGRDEDEVNVHAALDRGWKQALTAYGLCDRVYRVA